MYCLFELIFLLRFISLVSKSVFIAKFSCANLAAKLFAVKLLNSKLLTSDILFSTAFNAKSAAKPLTLGILLSISIILTL